MKGLNYDMKNSLSQSVLSGKIFDFYANRIMIQYDSVSFRQTHRILRSAIMASIIDALNAPINIVSKRYLGVKDTYGKSLYDSDLICYYHPVLCPAVKIEDLDSESALDYNQIIISDGDTNKKITMRQGVVSFDTTTGAFAPLVDNGHSFMSLLGNNKAVVKRVMNTTEPKYADFKFKGSIYNRRRR